MKTASGATAVQIVWSSRRRSRNIEHIGSARDDAELEALKAAAMQRLAAGRLELDLGTAAPGPSGPLPQCHGCGVQPGCAEPRDHRRA